MAIPWTMARTENDGIATSGFALLAMTWKIAVSCLCLTRAIINRWSAWAMPHALQGLHIRILTVGERHGDRSLQSEFHTPSGY